MNKSHGRDLKSAQQLVERLKWKNPQKELRSEWRIILE